MLARLAILAEVPAVTFVERFRKVFDNTDGKLGKRVQRSCRLFACKTRKTPLRIHYDTRQSTSR
jgi:hypothetical protein